VITFDGFLKVYLEGKDDEDDAEQEGLLPEMRQGEQLALQRDGSHPTLRPALRLATRKPAW
jgi:DNA topoisomerase IA